MFTFHIGRLCGGAFGVLFRWFGHSDAERFRLCAFWEGGGIDHAKAP